MQKRVNVIGVGASGIDSLSPEMLRVISSSDVLMGWERTLSLFEEVQIKKIPVVGGLSSIVSFIESSPEKSITILASGDPNFFGISEYLFKRVDKELLKIFPNVSSMQLAFAAVKESMNNAKIVSVHGRNLNTLDQALKGFEKVGVFTDQKNSPSKIAAHLLKKDGLELEAYLCENLGSENEAVRKLSLKALSSQTCSDLSIVVLIRKNRREEKKFPFGIPDEMFFTRNKMITKEEVRVITLAKLRLFSTAVFWDIGSGSGSVSIEAGFIARQGRVFAVEKDRSGVNLIKNNYKRFLLDNITVVNTSAPGGLDELPDPDAVFIGGSSGELTPIISYCFQRLKKGGRLAMNTVVLENLHEGIHAFKEAGAEAEVVQVAISKEKGAGSLKILASHNPVFILSSGKGPLNS